MVGYPALVLPGLVATYHCQLPGIKALGMVGPTHAVVCYPAVGVTRLECTESATQQKVWWVSTIHRDVYLAL